MYHEKQTQINITENEDNYTLTILMFNSRTNAEQFETPNEMKYTYETVKDCPCSFSGGRGERIGHS